MKHTLLATTALVALTGAAAAEISITATGRIGLKTTEGKAAVAGNMTEYADGVASTSAGTAGTASTAADITTRTNAVLAATIAYNAAYTGNVAAFAAGGDYTNAASKFTAVDTAYNTLQDAINELAAATGTAAVADDTSAVNRMRFTLKGSGETDGGISYGVSGRFEQSNTSTAGSQFVSGAFGKISMGDLDGADEVATGDGVASVGLTALGSHNALAYQSEAHNLGYQFSTSGMTFSYSQNTAVQNGSNSAMGLKYTGDMGGASITFGVGQSKVGTASQSTMSASVSSGGLTIKAISSSNDNGPATGAVAAAAQQVSATTGVVTTPYSLATVVSSNLDTDQTALSIAYTMDAMSVSAFTKTVSTSGVKDMDYSGLGFAYNLGGVTLKAGVVDNNDQQLVDFGLSFSF
jgi:outer membrane protein OmpU